MTRPYLGNPKYTIEVLQKYNFAFQKRFGQNFLIDTHVLEKIIDASQITKDDFVLEIGPGIGTMTQYLAEAAREVVAVEIDKTLIPILENDTLKEMCIRDRNYLLESIHDIQTMITCTGLDDFISHQFQINKVFHVVSGQVYLPHN